MLFPSALSDDSLDDIFHQVRRRFEMKPKIAIAGFGKAGKSSLFNAIYGETVAKVSMRTDETVEALSRERFGIDFTDTPGIGTGKFSLEKVRQMGVFDRQNVVIHVLNGASAITEEDELLHEMIEHSTARRITVINKVDLLYEDEQTDYAASMQDKLGLRPADFLFVSARRKIGISALIQRIAEILPDAMRDAFIAQQHADIAMKETRIRAVIYSKATICGATAAVPIPIADILVITPIQVALIVTIGFFYGVDITKARALELIATLGAGVGFREAARQIVKLIPGYGQVVSASVAFAGTVALGESANLWFKHKMRIDADELQTVFRKAAERARLEYEEYTQQQKALESKVNELRNQLADGAMTQDEFERRLAELDEPDDGT